MMRSAPASEPVNVVHVVTYPGENLGKISSWYTGNYENWREILKVNPQISKDKIHLGDRVLIPSRLLVQRAAMPQSFVAGRVAKNREALARMSDKKDDLKQSKKDRTVKDVSKDGKLTNKVAIAEKKEKKVKVEKKESVPAPSVSRESVKPEAGEPPAVEESVAPSPESETPSRSQMFTCRGEECEGLKNRALSESGQGLINAQ